MSGGPRDERSFTALLGGITSDAKELAQLCRYAELLESWSARHSLVSFRSREELVRRHLAEAREGARELGETGVMLDIGSGAGLPGIPLLIARPGWRGVLLEPRQKRWAFLKLVVRELGIPAEVVSCRYQDLRFDTPSGEETRAMSLGFDRFDVITVRALSVDREMLAWSRERLNAAGKLLVWSTEEILDRLRDLPGWHVLSSPLASRDKARLVSMQPCFT